MKSFGVKARSGLTLLKGGVSMVALTALAATLVAPAHAQDTQPAASSDSQEVVVVGVRKALKSAQQIKKDADTFVDSITANDIGSFPDKSVAEALQRVAGITVNRFAATGDTAHFSAEPSGVVVRGLQQVRSEFNGRDIFTADSSRGLSWSDVSPELMGGVDTYKNQTAELIEGGIAGSINLRTRLPFDQKGRVLAATAEYTYGDLVKKGAGSVSGIFSDRWDTSAGEFGLMVNAAHSQIYTNSEGIAFGRMVAVQNEATWGTADKRYIPSTISLRDNVYNRVRDGVAIAGQWQNHDHTMVATLQFNQSKKVEQWEEYVATAATGVDAYAQPIDYVSSGNNVECLKGTTCSFDADGYFQSGTLVQGNGAWYGSWTNPEGSTSPNGLMRADYDWSGTGVGAQRATGYANDTRWSDSSNDTSDLSFNFKWDISEKLKFNFDVQNVDATQKNYDISTELATYAAVTLDLSGDHPTMDVLPTDQTVGWYLAPGGITNPANYRQHFIMDHVTDSDGNEFATRADLSYSFDSPWLNTLKAGVRYADREQTVRWSTYNWANVVNNWSNYDRDNYFITGSKFPDANAYGIYSFDPHFYGGGVTNVSDGVFFNIDYLKNRAGLADTFSAANYQPVYSDSGSVSNQWTPICHRAGEDSDCFLPAEIADVSEKTKAAYVQLKFGGNDATINGITVVGNIGVRYVETDNESTGGVNYHNTTVYDTVAITPADPVSGAPAHPSLTYYVSQEDRDFAGTVNNDLRTASVKHINWLPSFNVRLGLTDKWFLRFAASRAMSRPDIGNLKSYTSVGMTLPTAASLTPDDYDCTKNTGKAFICDSAGNIVKTNVRFTASANNPYLKPITADQIDFSVENYFSSTGSLTLNLFYKKFHDYIQYGKYVADYTNAGVTRSVEVSGPVNGEGASIKGFEAAYTTFFDSLPSPWNGLGVQANYTHLVNSGIKSSNVVVNSGDGTSGQTGGGTSVAAVSFTDLPLEGLSDNSYNIIGMFEKGKWSARAAYNWRSKYLVTSQDCCVAFPIWQRAAGFLDARLAYRINDNVEVSVEGTNLLNTETVLLQQVDGELSTGVSDPRLLLPNAWFQNDRRVQASIRLKY